MSLARSSLRVGLIVALISLSALTSVAHATLLVVHSLADLVTDADRIVVVTGISETSRWDRYGRIVSDMQLRVTEVVKGDMRPGEQIVVTRLGGTVGEVAMTVAGEAHVLSGERAILFLDDIGSAGAHRVSSMSLGQFPIVTQQGVPTVLPSGAGLALVAEDATGALSPSTGPLQAPIALHDFLSVLRDLTRAR